MLISIRAFIYKHMDFSKQARICLRRSKVKDQIMRMIYFTYWTQGRGLKGSMN